MSYRFESCIPHSIHQTNTHNLMKSTTRSMNQSEGLKVNKKVNHLLPPYNQTTQQEQQQYEKSRQLSILPILQPTPSQLIHLQTNQSIPNHLLSYKKSLFLNQHLLSFYLKDKYRFHNSSYQN